MMRWVFPLCVAVWCCLLPSPSKAQTGSPANRRGVETYYHDDEYDATPAPGKAIDGALADLMPKLSGVKPKLGPLDTEGLKKALADGLRGVKPPDNLKITSSANCNVVDPQDVGGYWDGPAVFFAKTTSADLNWQTKLNIDEKKYALSGPPAVELRYHLVGKRLGGGAQKPYGKNVRVLTDYYITVEVTVVFDPQSVEAGTGGKFSGVAAGNPDPYTFRATVALTDRTKP